MWSNPESVCRATGFAALIDDESRVDDGEGSERHEGPEFVMDEDVPGSTDTETVGGQSDVEGPVEQSWSEPEPVQEAHPARMSAAFRDALRRLDQIDVVQLLLRACSGDEESSPVCSRSLHAAMRIASKRLRKGSNPRTKKGRAEDGNCSFFCPVGLIEEASSKATVTRQILALLERVMDRFVDPESRPC